MTIEEKAQIIKDNKNKKYLLISPRMFQTGPNLVTDYNSLDLYLNMEDNTKAYAEKEIVNLITNAEDEEISKGLFFSLVFCGDFKDFNDGNNNIVDSIMNNRDRIIAIYRYITEQYEEELFGVSVKNYTINKYGLLYLDFTQLLEEFDKNNISYNIDISIDPKEESIYRFGNITKLVISYNPNRELNDIKKRSRKK